MEVIRVRNVNQALAAGLRYLNDCGIEEPSRNGPVLVAPGPVCTVYTAPWERVLFSPLRDANPFFHLMEALWMLAGRNDLEFPQYFNGNFGAFSDDGKIVHGAYGYRWRKWFGYDQLQMIIEELRRNPESRRCVLTMWDAERKNKLANDYADDNTMLGRGGKDVPCNTHAYFDCRGGHVNMTVCCRSNDIWWGAYGANAVHFSILQEYVAACLEMPMGEYRQFSNNYHLYTKVVPRDRLLEFAQNAEYHDLYNGNLSTSGPLAESTQMFVSRANAEENWTPGQVNNFITNHVCDHSNAFLRDVAAPMREAYHTRKEKMGTGLGHIMKLPVNSDWRIACAQWIKRREESKKVWIGRTEVTGV